MGAGSEVDVLLAADLEGGRVVERVAGLFGGAGVRGAGLWAGLGQEFAELRHRLVALYPVQVLQQGFDPALPDGLLPRPEPLHLVLAGRRQLSPR
ncbi:hypothetical protein L1606_01770 [Streptomyces spororaveus]|uniref:hypothetical protein n=1 Tax=Streptomyces spororaveus TaxID=284039 RepID=UPI002079EEB9|nr:hypothetical protein [Streptomyces spororaveus]MCM9076841.1 hypothetical protein [Streptomyces spororaveus]